MEKVLWDYWFDAPLKDGTTHLYTFIMKTDSLRNIPNFMSNLDIIMMYMWNVDNVCLLMLKKNNKNNKINNLFWCLLPCCFTHVMSIARVLRSQSFRHLQSRAPTALAVKVLSSRWRRHGSGFGLSDFQPNMGHVGPGQPCTRTFRSSGYFSHPEVSSAVERVLQWFCGEDECWIQ